MAPPCSRSGVVYTTAGKAGFITGLYVLFVPLFGLLVGKRTSGLTWVGAVLAAVGLYLLSAKGLTGIALGDGLVLLSAVFWALHVLAIDRYVHRVQPLQLATTQFAVCGALSLAGALVFETPDPAAVRAATLPILYAGLLSTGVAYTLQVVAQRKAHPSHAAIILSLESVFAVLGGWLILSESLSARGLAGCGVDAGGYAPGPVSASSPDLKDQAAGRSRRYPVKERPRSPNFWSPAAMIGANPARLRFATRISTTGTQVLGRCTNRRPEAV